MYHLHTSRMWYAMNGYKKSIIIYSCWMIINNGKHVCSHKLHCEITCSHRVCTCLSYAVDIHCMVAPAPSFSLAFGNHGNQPHIALRVIGEILYIHTFLTSLYKFNSPLPCLAWVSLPFLLEHIITIPIISNVSVVFEPPCFLAVAFFVLLSLFSLLPLQLSFKIHISSRLCHPYFSFYAFSFLHLFFFLEPWFLCALVHVLWENSCCL